MHRLPLVLAALALAFPATASAKLSKCPQSSPYELIKVENVGCARAKSVVKDFFKDQVAPSGWDCRQKQYPGGVTTTCRKRDATIKHFSAD